MIHSVCLNYIPWDCSVQQWCRENIGEWGDSWLYHGAGEFVFLHAEDAVLFQLTWA